MSKYWVGVSNYEELIAMLDMSQYVVIREGFGFVRPESRVGCSTCAERVPERCKVSYLPQWVHSTDRYATFIFNCDLPNALKWDR